MFEALPSQLAYPDILEKDRELIGIYMYVFIYNLY
jgi:hypothetical protein